MKIFKQISLLACLLCLGLMTTSALHAEETKTTQSENTVIKNNLQEKEKEKGNQEKDPDQYEEGKAKQGIASYYAKKFIGRKTSSGHRYHPEKMAAAHYTLPLGTVVKVVNIATGQEVIVTINDRCARKKFTFIDLSTAAAKKIGLLGKGKMKVLITPLKKIRSKE